MPNSGPGPGPGLGIATFVLVVTLCGAQDAILPTVLPEVSSTASSTSSSTKTAKIPEAVTEFNSTSPRSITVISSTESLSTNGTSTTSNPVSPSSSTEAPSNEIFADPTLDEQGHPTSYRFKYLVHDAKTGDYKTQEEIRENGIVRGTYTVGEPNGDLRVVTYTAGSGHGFRAMVRVEPGWLRPWLASASSTPQDNAETSTATITEAPKSKVSTDVAFETRQNPVEVVPDPEPLQQQLNITTTSRTLIQPEVELNPTLEMQEQNKLDLHPDQEAEVVPRTLNHTCGTQQNDLPLRRRTADNPIPIPNPNPDAVAAARAYLQLTLPYALHSLQQAASMYPQPLFPAALFHLLPSSSPPPEVDQPDTLDQSEGSGSSEEIETPTTTVV